MEGHVNLGSDEIELIKEFGYLGDTIGENYSTGHLPFVGQACGP